MWIIVFKERGTLMAKGPIARELREELISNIRGGMTVREASERYGVSAKTIYTWLRKSADGARGQTLELSRVKRENEALYRLLGRLTYQLSAGEKK